MEGKNAISDSLVLCHMVSAWKTRSEFLKSIFIFIWANAKKEGKQNNSGLPLNWYKIVLQI